MTGQRDDKGVGAPESNAQEPDGGPLPNASSTSGIHATWPSAKPSSGSAIQQTLRSERESPAPASQRRSAPLAREVGGGRFELAGHLGAGAMGVVYAAYDRQRRERVALKTLQNLDGASIQRLKQEFRSLASVAHPNLVRLRELFADADEVFFTMDLVEGVPLSSFLEADPVQKGGFHTLRNVFRQLAEGLGALHSNGKIHRDLKPSNVMVRNDGRVVVLDFGVTCDVDAVRATAELGVLAGTPAYMAPEQILGEGTSIASDWYAFGSILYEALTGKLPFDGALLELLNAKTSGTPNPIDRDVPEDLKALTFELLSRAPDSRPRGAEVRARLGAEPESIHNDSRRPVGSSGKKAEFVGREQQLRTLEAALHRTLQGELVTVLVSGASGIGKTTLVKEFLDDDCRAKGALVLQSKCFEQEFVRYNAFDGVIDGLRSHLRRLPAETRARLTPRHAGALAAVFPTLADALARDAPRERLPVQPGERRRMAFYALRELVGRLADTTPVVMFLDDLQWGDSDSARLLAVLLSEPDPPPVLIVASCRSDERMVSPLIRTLEAEGKGVWNPLEIEVTPLADAEATHLVSRLLGETARQGVESIVAEAGGNPFFLLEMALASQEEHATDLRGAPLADVITSRVRSLPRIAQELLEAVAIAERPIAVQLVEQAATAGEDADAGWLALKRAKLVRSVFAAGEALIQCYHDRIRETVQGALDASRAAELHERIGEALEARPTTDPEQLAEHFHRCKNLEKARRYARLAGDAARTGLAFARAARWYRLAFEISEAGDPSRKSLRVDLAEALENSGHAYQAAEHYLAAASDRANDDDALEFRRRAAGQLLGSARTDEGLAVLETVLRDVGMKSPRTMAGAVASLVWDRAALRLRGLAFEERPASQVKRADLQRIDAIAVAAAGFTRSDFLRGAVFACKELRLALEAGEITRIGRALGSEVLFVANEGISQSDRVAALRDMANGLMTKIGDERVLGYLKACAGASHLLLGDSASATPELADAVALLERGRPSWELTFTRGLWGLSVQIRGGLIQVGEAYTNWLADARERADLQAERYFAINHSFSYLGLDTPDEAHSNLVRALAATEKAGNDFLHFAGLHAFVLIATYRHEGPEVFERLATQHQAFWRSPLRGGQLSRAYVRVYLGYCALVAEAYKRAGRRDLGAAHRIAKELFKEKARFAEAHGHLIRAAAFRLEDKLEDAAAELVLGADAFDTLGQELQAGAARFQLGKLLSNEEGQSIVSEALGVARRLKVKDPVRMYEAYTPGFWP